MHRVVNIQYISEKVSPGSDFSQISMTEPVMSDYSKMIIRQSVYVALLTNWNQMCDVYWLVPVDKEKKKHNILNNKEI